MVEADFVWNRPSCSCLIPVQLRDPGIEKMRLDNLCQGTAAQGDVHHPTKGGATEGTNLDEREDCEGEK